MKRIMILGLTVMFIIAVPFTVMGAPKAHSGTSGYVVNNPNHTQALGGSSTHASNGLSVASQHSKVVVDPPPVSSGTGGSGSVPVVTPIQ